jgi:uncharacterized protein YutE (UPF0331/DUF86 family)
MKREREELLETNIKERAVDARRHLEAVELAAAEFGDFELSAFEAAWRATDPGELQKAYAVQAGYEHVLNAVIKIAEELAELEGWTPPNSEPSAIEALKALHDNGVIAAATRTALKEAQERRNDVQHDYVRVAAREIHESVTAVLEYAPLLLQGVADQLHQRG